MKIKLISCAIIAIAMSYGTAAAAMDDSEKHEVCGSIKSSISHGCVAESRKHRDAQGLDSAEVEIVKMCKKISRMAFTHCMSRIGT
jgi:hypothetical protein